VGVIFHPFFFASAAWPVGTEREAHNNKKKRAEKGREKAKHMASESLKIDFDIRNVRVRLLIKQPKGVRSESRLLLVVWEQKSRHECGTSE
jgi:hypothetical protein